MDVFASQLDAQEMLDTILSQSYAQQCFIGRDNTRSDRATFIVAYWKPAAGLILLNPGIIQLQPTVPIILNPGIIQAIATPTPGLIILNPGVIQLGVTPTLPPAVQQPVSGDDCLPYDPASLYVVQEGDHWLLTNGQMRMNLLDNQADANAALGIARQFTAQCYLGRGNSRPDPANYVFLYWQGDSGMGQPSSDSDCYQYNPDSLYVVQDGDHWLLTDGLARMNIFDTQDEANKALAVVKPYNGQCWLGRNNQRADRLNYIFPYWTRLPIGTGQQGQGQPPTIPPVVFPPSATPAPALPPAAVMSAEDCLPYNVAALYVVQDGDHWLLTDGLQRLVIYDNQADANLGLTVARQHTQICFIGRNNTRPNRSDFISTYWK